MSTLPRMRVERNEMKRRTQGPDLDHWLESGLRQTLDPFVDRPAPSPRYLMATGARRSFSWLRPALVTGSGLAGLLTLTAITASAATGSVNPAVWGQRVSSAVVACKNASSTGDHGIGPCVRGFVHTTKGSPAASSVARHGGGGADPGSSGQAPGDLKHDAGAATRKGLGSPAAGDANGSPHPTVAPDGNPRTPQDPTGDPHPNATPPGQGGVNPGQGHTR
jgi:hypothetical protein